MPKRTRSDGVESRERIAAALDRLGRTGVRPTAQELALVTGLSQTNVRHHVRTLLADGVVTIAEVPTRRVRREIVLVHPPCGEDA